MTAPNPFTEILFAFADDAEAEIVAGIVRHVRTPSGCSQTVEARFPTAASIDAFRSRLAGQEAQDTGSAAKVYHDRAWHDRFLNRATESGETDLIL